MRKLCALLLAIVITVSLTACGKVEEPVKLAFNDDPEAITAASASVVMISVYNKADELIATGSGFPAFEDGIIITNAHVIEGGDHFEANTETELYFKINSVVAVDYERDIAILKTNATTGLAVLPVGDSSTLMKGEKVVAIGSPLGLINTVSEGMYSNVRTENGRTYLQFTAEISEGSSGGALFNNSGEIIGVTSASYVKGSNLNLAVPIEDVVDVWQHQDEYPVQAESADPDLPSVFTCKEIFEMDKNLLNGLNVTVKGYFVVSKDAVYMAGEPSSYSSLSSAIAWQNGISLIKLSSDKNLGSILQSDDYCTINGILEIDEEGRFILSQATLADE